MKACGPIPDPGRWTYQSRLDLEWVQPIIAIIVVVQEERFDTPGRIIGPEKRNDLEESEREGRNAERSPKGETALIIHQSVCFAFLLWSREEPVAVQPCPGSGGKSYVAWAGLRQCAGGLFCWFGG